MFSKWENSQTTPSLVPTPSIPVFRVWKSFTAGLLRPSPEPYSASPVQAEYFPCSYLCSPHAVLWPEKSDAYYRGGSNFWQTQRPLAEEQTRQVTLSLVISIFRYQTWTCVSPSQRKETTRKKQHLFLFMKILLNTILGIEFISHKYFLPPKWLKWPNLLILVDTPQITWVWG